MPHITEYQSLYSITWYYSLGWRIAKNKPEIKKNWMFYHFCVEKKKTKLYITLSAKLWILFISPNPKTKTVILNQKNKKNS